MSRLPTASDRVRDTEAELWDFVVESVMSPGKWSSDEFQRLLGNYAGALRAEERGETIRLQSALRQIVDLVATRPVAGTMLAMADIARRAIR